jgi:hypothetical protein
MGTIWRNPCIPTTVTRFSICYTSSNISRIIASLPKHTLQRLCILDCQFHLGHSPAFPRVEKLCLGLRGTATLKAIQEKFPGLRRLAINESSEPGPVDLRILIGSKITKLRISSDQSIDLTPLSTIETLTDLDVEKCPRIVNYDAVRHVSNVIKYVPRDECSVS